MWTNYNRTGEILTLNAVNLRVAGKTGVCVCVCVCICPIDFGMSLARLPLNA